MDITQKPTTVEELNALRKNTIAEALGIRIIHVGDKVLEGEMPVDHRTHQPFGLLHGGASVVLAETLGSIAANLFVPDTHFCVGLEVNANHIRAVKEGKVIGRAHPLHLGKSTQVWEIKISTEDHKLVCISRLTVSVVPKK